MKRDLMPKLIEWKRDSSRVPLIIRGARQVGKTWLIRKFGESFESFVEFNLEFDQDVHAFFQGRLDIEEILRNLSLYSGTEIVPGKTLLFLDEVQESKDSLRVLRYFKENCPELHVIATGSLLDFLLEEVGMPVGRVEYLFLHPLSFGEFLEANGLAELRALLPKSDKEQAIHLKIRSVLKDYLWLGGMPDVVQKWVQDKNPEACQRIQDRLLLSYQDDFLKYAKRYQIKYLSKVFQGIPRQLGQKFTYVHVDRDVQSRDLKKALELLCMAQVAQQCFHSSAHEWPLGSQINDKKFKVFFLDIGLAQRLQGLDLAVWIKDVYNHPIAGGVAEQFIAQEYIAYSSVRKPSKLYYWHRESKSANAELDFLFSSADGIVPIEVKAGAKGRMKSLKVFFDTHPDIQQAVKFLDRPMSRYGKILELPLYGVEAWFAQNSV